MSVKITSLKERRSQRKTLRQRESNMKIINEAQIFLQSFDQAPESTQQSFLAKPPSAAKSTLETSILRSESKPGIQIISQTDT
jgi:hypothetical protein